MRFLGNMLTIIKTHWASIIRSLLVAMGVLWLPIEVYEGLENTDASISYTQYIIGSIVVGLGLFFVDGYFISGFLKNRVEITNNGFDTKISIIFDDIFEQNGWKSIGVNDFFDHIVDEDLVSSKSLHGHVINSYWPENSEDWKNQIRTSLADVSSNKEKRAHGNKRRYQIGTTAIAIKDNQKMLFVALGETDTQNNVTTASAESLIRAIRGLLEKARAVCANEPLYIPLMGSGLGRVGIKNSILVDLILVAIVEETKKSKITDSITIVLPDDKKSEINLGNFTRDWNKNG